MYIYRSGPAWRVLPTRLHPDNPGLAVWRFYRTLLRQHHQLFHSAADIDLYHPHALVAYVRPIPTGRQTETEVRYRPIMARADALPGDEYRLTEHRVRRPVHLRCWLRPTMPRLNLAPVCRRFRQFGRLIYPLHATLGVAVG